MKLRIFFVGVALLAIGGSSLAEPKVFSVTVKRVMGEYESRDELREFATLEAKRQALEQAGAYLETQTVVQNSRLVKDEITALAAAVLSTKQADEKWEMEGGHFVIWLTYEITIETDDLERRIKVLIQERRKIEDYRRLQAENGRLQKEIENLRQKIEQTGTANITALKKETEDSTLFDININNWNFSFIERARLNYKSAAAEWFDKALAESEPNIKIEYYSYAIKLDPDWIWSYFNRGLAYYNCGKYDQAILDNTKVISVNPDDEYAFFHRGLAYKMKGDNYRAKQDFLKADSLSHPGAYKYLDILDDE
ncbi:MAG: tetratricopeptide repeat protein [FCB group bacterium]|nr:tetratricopeptide repeat protein [FCB group bacterium]